MFDMGMFTAEIIEFYKDYDLFLHLIDDDFKLAKHLLQVKKRPSYLRNAFYCCKIETVQKNFSKRIDELLSMPHKDLEQLINEYKQKELIKCKISK